MVDNVDLGLCTVIPNTMENINQKLIKLDQGPFLPYLEQFRVAKQVLPFQRTIPRTARKYHVPSFLRQCNLFAKK